METRTKRIADFLRQYKYAALIVALGLMLMLLPGKKAEQPVPATETIAQDDTALHLEEILSKIQGVGKVQVMLTLDSGEEVFYEYHEDRTVTGDTSDIRRQIVLINGADRAQEGLVRLVRGPEYRGAIVVCQGADLASVRLAVVEAVSNATGLSSDKITVLKMK